MKCKPWWTEEQPWSVVERDVALAVPALGRAGAGISVGMPASHAAGPESLLPTIPPRTVCFSVDGGFHWFWWWNLFCNQVGPTACGNVDSIITPGLENICNDLFPKSKFAAGPSAVPWLHLFIYLRIKCRILKHSLCGWACVHTTCTYLSWGPKKKNDLKPKVEKRNNNRQNK